MKAILVHVPSTPGGLGTQVGHFIITDIFKRELINGQR
jgi:hypothetical protein